MFRKGRKRGDKVFDNSYNEGTLNNFNDNEIVIDEYYRKKYLDREFNMENNFRIDELSEIIYGIIKNSNFSYILKDKKIIKKIVPELLIFVLAKLEEKESKHFTLTEKFFVMCNVLDLKENVVYDNLPEMYKNMALDEIKTYTNIKRKVKSKVWDISIDYDDSVEVDNPDEDDDESSMFDDAMPGM